jgi:hypothetical protein
MRLYRSEVIDLETAKRYAHNWSQEDMEMYGVAPLMRASSNTTRNAIQARDHRNVGRSLPSD